MKVLLLLLLLLCSSLAQINKDITFPWDLDDWPFKDTSIPTIDPNPTPTIDPNPSPTINPNPTPTDVNFLDVEPEPEQATPDSGYDSLFVSGATLQEHTKAISESSRNEEIVTLAYSGDGKSSKVISTSTKVPSEISDDESLPGAIQMPQPDFPTPTIPPTPPNNQEIYPGPTKELLNSHLFVVYQIQFYNECPQNPVYLHIHSTDPFRIYDQDTHALIYPKRYKWAKPGCHIIKLPAKCGCNRLLVILYNWQYSSSYGIWYQIYQSNYNCYNCLGQGGVYNRETCQCQCDHISTDCANSNKVWVGYPTCRCKCGISAFCIPPKYFNKKTCSCECPPICCEQYGWTIDKITCECVPGISTQPPTTVPIGPSRPPFIY